MNKPIKTTRRPVLNVRSTPITIDRPSGFDSHGDLLVDEAPDWYSATLLTWGFREENVSNLNVAHVHGSTFVASFAYTEYGRTRAEIVQIDKQPATLATSSTRDGGEFATVFDRAGRTTRVFIPAK